MKLSALLRYGLRYLGHIGVFALGLISIIATGDGDGFTPKPDTFTEVPVQLSLENIPLSAGVPTTFTYTIDVNGTPYTEITLDVEKTLQAASIVVTPVP